MAQRRKKILAFISPALVGKFEALAHRSGLSRSELYRFALEKGYDATASWVERSYPALAEPLDRSAVSAGAGVGSDQPLAALERLARALFEQVPDMTEDVFRQHLTAQATVLGLSPLAMAGALDALVAQRFPARIEPESPGPAVSSDIAAVPDLD